jgi:hypothetical protein
VTTQPPPSLTGPPSDIPSALTNFVSSSSSSSSSQPPPFSSSTRSASTERGTNTLRTDFHNDSDRDDAMSTYHRDRSSVSIEPSSPYSSDQGGSHRRPSMSTQDSAESVGMIRHYNTGSGMSIDRHRPQYSVTAPSSQARDLPHPAPRSLHLYSSHDPDRRHGSGSGSSSLLPVKHHAISDFVTGPSVLFDQ